MPIVPATTNPPVLTASTTPVQPVKPAATTTVATVTTAPSTLKTTPQGSSALAAFAADATVPSAPRIPVAVTQATNVKPVVTEPPLSARELEQITAAVKAEDAQVTVKQVAEPQATQAEKDEVVKEIKAIAPQGTEIVDPYDGKIKLTAIQTSQSVAEQQGRENTVGFAYPKGLAEPAAVTSDEAKLNQDKKFAKTESEVVVVPPTGKRSTYTVLSGDTLATIAMKNGVNWRDIAKWNQVDPNGTLFVGATLYLYDAKPQEVEAPAKKAESTPATYVVKANDSLTGVANQFNLSVSQLASYNNLTTTSNLFVGQKLNLKDNGDDKLSALNKTLVRSDTSKPEAKIKTKPYVVKRGEYLKVIADRYALSVQELADLTPGLEVGNLFVGQKINVPMQEVEQHVEKIESKVVDQTKFKNVQAETRYKTENYHVKSGDTLSSIAVQSKISLSELAELNNLSISKGLLVGQTIKVPEGSTVPDNYTVQSGDSLSSVASKYNMSVSQIADLNGINSNAGLFVGQKIKLSGEPVQAKNKQVEPEEVVNNSRTAEKDIHVVKAGDTIASVAKKYHLQVAFLTELNGLSKNAKLRAGQRLKIDGELPSKSSVSKETENVTSTKTTRSIQNTEAYTVKSGESLNLIANRLGISANELAELNNLNGRTGLQRGQSIRIPKTVIEYKVKSGDSLIRLASKYGIASNELAELNDMKPSTQLRIGDVIKVPNL